MGDNNSGSKRYTEKYMIPLELAEGATVSKQKTLTMFPCQGSGVCIIRFR